MKLDKKFLAITAVVIAVFVLAGTATLYNVPRNATQTTTESFDFTVSGSSSCLRFLNSSVPTYYVPFTVAANQNYQLTINCTKMPGGASGWTDVYVYDGYWDEGTNHTCKAMDLYPILNDIQATNLEVKINQPYVGNFGDSIQKSYTVFFIIPPGGQSTFHVTYKPA